MAEELSGFFYPTKVNAKKWWIRKPIEPIGKLRPKPKKDILLIVGDSTGVWDDLEEFFALGVDHDTMLINNVASVYPWPFEHYIAGDSHMKDMQDIAKSLPKKVIKHCWNPTSHGFDVRWLKSSGGWTGTTAMLGIWIGLTLDYLKMVFVGIPMDNSGHWYNPGLAKNDKKVKSDHTAHLWKWTELAARPMRVFIRSMSGNTADLFGKPTRDWLLDIPEGGDNGCRS